MKKLLFFAINILLFWSCSSVQKTSAPNEEIAITSDSTEYEIAILDSDFDVWYLMNYSPSKDRTNDFYRTSNLIAVSNWNNYYLHGKYSRVIGNHIFYDNSIDYGIEVNRKLYWYFKFAETKSHIRLLR